MEARAALAGVLFDLDGTLVDTSGDFIFLLAELAEREGVEPIPTSRIRSGISGGSRLLIETAFGLDEDDADFRRLQQSLLARYRDVVGERCVFFPGIETIIERLRQLDLPWGVVTNKPERFATPLLQRLGLGEVVLRCPEHVGRGKPAPDSVHAACEALGCAEARTLFIGDDRRDILAGRAAGTMTAAALWGFQDNDSVAEWDAEWELPTPAEALQLIERLHGEGRP